MDPLIFSPFDPGRKATVIAKISTAEIIDGYRTYLNIDVTHNFKNIRFLFICECPLSNLIFFYPLNLDGDAKFYEELSAHNWYYNQNRWEHDEALNLINSGTNVLEIGSGDGAFLQKLTGAKPVSYTGLELNTEAIRNAEKKGITLIHETLNQHVRTNSNKYDVVSSFQVLEHVSDIKSMLDDSLKALKKGGLLIIAVPNNDASFLKTNAHPSRFLNMPPHHVNRFTEKSLTRIAELYGLELKRIIKEPLQESHIDVFLYNKFLSMFFKSRFILRVFWKLKLHVLFRPFLRILRHKIIGHTIISVYKKS